MSFRPSLCALCALVLGACASLEVKVDILNPTVVSEISERGRLVNLYYMIAKSTPSSIDVEVDQLRKRHQAANDALADQYDKAAAIAGVPAPAVKTLKDSATDLRSILNAGGPFTSFYTTYEQVLNDQDEAVRSAAGAQPFENGELTPAVAAALRTRRVRLDEAASEIFKNIREAENDVRAVAASAATPTGEADQQAKIQAVKLVHDTITSGRTLVGSEFAYAVMSADETAWKNDFNRAYGGANLGSSDIVIKLDKSGEFTVKGMQFDPSSVATVASKVTTQALLLAAKMAGAPVEASAISDANGKNKGLVEPGDSDISRQNVLLKRSAQVDAREQALRDLARTVLSEERPIAGTTAERTAAYKTIKDQFDAYADIIKLTSIQ